MFRSWAKTIGRVDRDLAEEALAHTLNETEAAYDRDPAVEPRREIMARYAAWLTAETPTTNVVTFRKAS